MTSYTLIETFHTRNNDCIFLKYKLAAWYVSDKSKIATPSSYG